MKLKRFVPIVFKKPFWWLFKAPQHKAGCHTFGVEMRGYLGLLSDSLFSWANQSHEPITICVSNKNRSEALINYLLKSLLEAHNSHLIYLSVYDCGSEDATILEQTLRDKLGVRLHFESQSMPFARSIAMNHAVNNAGTSLLFITDADISLPKNIVEKVNFYLKGNRLWFPICRAFTSREETASIWYMEGKGVLACKKEQFLKVEGYDETIIHWGKEDTDLWFRFWQMKYFCYRTKERDLVHHWHHSVEGAKKQWS